jgi:hypothetical protein
MISLASLDPDLVKAAINGRLPRGIGVTRLSDAPLEWSRQWHMLGLAKPTLLAGPASITCANLVSGTCEPVSAFRTRNEF